MSEGGGLMKWVFKGAAIGALLVAAGFALAFLGAAVWSWMNGYAVPRWDEMGLLQAWALLGASLSAIGAVAGALAGAFWGCRSERRTRDA